VIRDTETCSSALISLGSAKFEAGSQTDVPSFFLNNQLDAPIIQIYSVIKFYIFRASSLLIVRNFYCTFGTVKLHAGF
jgi:hypothetical protein